MRSILCILFVALVCGCAATQLPTQPPTKPTPAPELVELQRLLGSWDTSWTMISPNPEELKEQMPTAKAMPATFKGEAQNEWTMDGMYLKGTGWHEMPEGRTTFEEFTAWDPAKKKFRHWYFTDWGSSGEAWWSVDKDDARILHVTGVGRDASGGKTRFRGTMTFTDENTMEWVYKGTGPAGKLELQGTQQRKH